MRKFTVILMMALLALPMMAQKTAATKAADIREKMGRVDDHATFAPIKAFDGTIQAAPKNRGGETVLWDFDSDDALEGWTVIDSDGDGMNWGINTDANNVHSGSQSLVSVSYEAGTAYDPDNWLISPQVELGGILSIWTMNYSSYFAEQIGIYVCVGEFTSVEDFVELSGPIVPGTSWFEYTYSLERYAGQVGHFAIRHYDSFDNYRIYIDDIALLPPPISAPQNLTVVPAATTADVAWEDSENAAWNLRYREIVEGSENNLLWEFEEDTNGNANIDLTGGWTSIDADGDGNGWYHLTGENFVNHGGLGHVTSASYNGNALTPDNWLVSPQVELNGTLSFWAAGQDPSYAEEVFTVYVSTGDPTDVAGFTAISADLTATGVMTEYTFDLSSYAGAMGYVAIRHHDVTDMFRLNIDDIAINYAPDAEWIDVNGLDETSYTIDGLLPETTYEVQVQSTDETREVSDWTESVVFTTLAEEEYVYSLLGFNDWESPIEIGEEGATIDVLQQDFENPDDTAQEFKVVKVAEDGTYTWLGGIDENGAGFFLIDEGLLDVNITLDDQGSNFRLAEPGNYTIKLVKEAIKAPVEGVKMVVTKNQVTAIETVKSEVKGDNNYYNLMGQKMNGSNLPAGIYIHNGKKVVIK